LAPLDSKKLESMIKKCLNDFHERRIEKLKGMRLREVLKRKNPYLFRALGTEQAAEIVKKILEAYVSSSDETIFRVLTCRPAKAATWFWMKTTLSMCTL
jgi:hypothetical protein